MSIQIIEIRQFQGPATVELSGVGVPEIVEVRQGPAGVNGPNSVTSATTSDGTCDLSLDTLTVGISTASGVRAVAIGQSTASGALSFASGASTATDDYCFANGDGSTASGYAATASGAGAIASGYASTAFGNGTTASGYASTASGTVSTASGDFSIAIGYRAKAIHDGASVESDSQDADVESTTTDEKTFRFQNGYRFLGGAVTIDGTLNAAHIHGNVAGSVYAHVRAGENLAKGDPVYISGSHGTGANLIAIVSKADASNAAKMPAVGVMDAAVSNNANGHMVITGTISDIDTNAYAVNSVLYVASGGGFTTTPPAANSQPVAIVERSNTNNGAVIVKVNGLASSGGNGASDANKLARYSSAGTLPIASIGGLGSNVSTFLATPTSANLAAAVTDETGSGSLVFAQNSTLSGTTLNSLERNTLGRIAALTMSQSPPCSLFEDFCGTSGTGIFSWTTSGTGSDSIGSVGQNSFGVRRMTTGTTSGNQRRTILPIPTSTIFGTEIRAHFAIPDVTTMSITIGMEQTSGAFGRYLLTYNSGANSGFWYLITGTGAGSTTNFGTNGPSNGNFASGKRYRSILRPVNATTVYVKIDEADWNANNWTNMFDGNVTIASYTPNSDPIALDFRVNTTTNAARSLDLDYASVENTSIVR